MATSAKPAGADSQGKDPWPKKLLLLDGHSMAFRAYYALPPEKFTVAGGDQSTNAVYGFTSMLTNVVRDEAPTHSGGVLRRVPRGAQAHRDVPGVQGAPVRFAGTVPRSGRPDRGADRTR